MNSPYEEDQHETDPLESRWFYELMQSYRHERLDPIRQFEDVKSFIRMQSSQITHDPAP